MGINFTNTGQKTINKWVTGKRDIGDLIKKYNVPSEEPGRRQQPSSNTSTSTWRRRRAAAAEPSIQQHQQQQQQQQGREWVDDRYIKTYTEYSEMMSMFEDITRKYPKISERYGMECQHYPHPVPSFSLGTSEEGRKLECFHVAGEVRRPRPLLRPMVKLVANIHGDEVVGRELLIALAR